jgi:hypothetical protein
MRGDQWHSSRESTALIVVIINFVETLKVRVIKDVKAKENMEQALLIEREELARAGEIERLAQEKKDEIDSAISDRYDARWFVWVGLVALEECYCDASMLLA